MYQIGYARVDITPTESVPLAGYGMTHRRMSTNVLDPLYSTCTALTDENGVTVLLIHNDLISSPVHFSMPIREAVSQATGVPVDYVLVCATHTHSAPDIHNLKMACIRRYNESLPAKIAQCAQEALADRKPARCFAGKTRTHRLNFVRHYILEDGHYKGDNFGTQYDSPIASHTSEADPEMRLVKFVRQGGKDVLMVNWQAHPLCTGGNAKPDVSADFVGAFRKEMEQALDCHFTYFTGGAGNISHYSRIPGEMIAHTNEEYGIALKNHAMTVEYEELALAPIRLMAYNYQEPLNRPDAASVERAQKVMDFWTHNADNSAAVQFALEYGFSSQYDAALLLARHKLDSDVVDIPLTAISFGAFGFASTPCEVFDTNAKYVRDFSALPMTFISSTTNDGIPYIPSAYGFVHGCYEAACTRCKPGAGERVAQTLVTMLHSLK